MPSVDTIYTLSWKTTGGVPEYFLNDETMGRGAEGFDHLLQVLEKCNPRTLVILFTLLGGNTGKPVTASFPFQVQFRRLQALSRKLSFSIRLESYS